MVEKCCKICRFFHQGNGLIPRCRRFPPSSTGYFVPTTGDNWCGEYELKPEPYKERYPG